MFDVAENNLILLVIALVIGLAVALWIFRGRSRSDGPEGNALPDEFAAATQDVAGEILGVDAHPTIPGPSGPPDNLQRLKGVGPKLAAQLNEAGITRYDQLAGLTENEVALLDKRMGAFEGRIARDRLVEQACFLERGDIDGFEAKFGKLGGA
jgi:predicted flap endonuclease-1-like 5' DNA nuclease